MATTTWNIDPSHSSIGFSVRHLVIAKVHGRFGTFSGTITLDDDLARSRVDVKIDAASLDTREEKRDGHLRSADFFDVEKFPHLTFVGKSVEVAGGKAKSLTGDLTIHGVTRAVTLAVDDLGRAKDPWGNERVAFEAKGSIDRKDFGLKWNQALETGGVLVGEKVDLSIEVQAVLAK